MINSKETYRAALDRIDTLMDFLGDEPGQESLPEYKEFVGLVNEVVAYEDIAFPEFSESSTYPFQQELATNGLNQTVWDGFIGNQ